MIIKILEIISSHSQFVNSISDNDLVHGWGLDFALQQCVEPAYEKIRVGVPSLGNQVRERCQSEWKLFRDRVSDAYKDYYKSIGFDPLNKTAH